MVNKENFIIKLKENNKDALQYIIDNFTPLIFTICKSIIGEYGTLEDVEECVSDIFIFLWNNKHNYSEEKSSFKTWISVIAKYKSIDFKRKLIKKLNFETNFQESSFIYKNDVEDELMSKELNNKIILLVNSLKTLDKQLFIKRYFLNQTIEDIAKEFNLTRQAVDNRLYRTRKILKKNLVYEVKEVL
ncbi:RNA polymerase sigma-70 factor (ECF subfamily) [Clostridium tetanomorphum]|uniref:Sigma-70 family RNA polymerase sigma factor n=1 Tax=Clostridium tetanomorphum TaxID=1553 RepID=A0A923E9Z0_CLOTT|nr:sigma-70 family RNA polymerase sigma factor [Clostridium tetanomorphum]KAJ51022.1 RNA polymerase factor sigma-70 [Clostridium tetanomorphum DSM 665]MBC2399332.1 sigma-70 family RNA polymerase sigma factor [Clostridium tetanomorphum]MBP1865878.1 RNA polymerase sigma-70 factor (ECF subfamily) [Clostridium tetanomorphum]NRS85327.1 RNA polymerase sigma-70 factor (ECF subfamily) [Clostridium tetanomorphum]NRZ98506.1 RNA polymerase sigma-70 factor (ECF subfamily) [Clostridium tetanomorphum]